MIIETTRFGPVSVDEDRLLIFPDGLVGFGNLTRYALISTGPQSSFFWLQSIDHPDVAFVVTDPRLFVPDYEVPVRPEDAQRLAAEPSDTLQLFIVVNKVDGVLTGNLQGPILVNPGNRQGVQLVLSDKRYTTRRPLLRLPARPPAVSQSA